MKKLLFVLITIGILLCVQAPRAEAVFDFDIGNYTNFWDPNIWTYHETGVDFGGIPFSRVREVVGDGSDQVLYESTGVGYIGVFQFPDYPDTNYEVLRVTTDTGVEVIQYVDDSGFSLFGSPTSTEPTGPAVVAPVSANDGDVYVAHYKEYMFDPAGNPLGSQLITETSRFSGVDSVTVPAGTFKNILKINSTSTIAGEPEIEVFEGFYARSYGLIKSTSTVNLNTLTEVSNRELTGYSLHIGAKAPPSSVPDVDTLLESNFLPLSQAIRGRNLSNELFWGTNTDGAAVNINGVWSVETASPVFLFSEDFTFPSESKSLSFDFLLEDPLPDDYFVFQVDDDPLFTLFGSSFPGNDFINSGDIDVSQYAGSTRHLSFIYNSSEAARIAQIRNIDLNVVPEPATMLLFGSGIAGMAFSRRRKRK